jgi:steroid 5-alpha reductase family enzyme
VIEATLQTAAVIAAMMTIVWLFSLWLKDASVVDLAWGFGFALIAWTVCLLSVDRQASGLLPILTTVWGARLSFYLTWRNHGQPEDFRYRAMREKWGRAFPVISLLGVFGLQGLIMWVVSLPLQMGIAAPDRGWNWLTALGAAVWSAGLLFESIGDWQLARFKMNPHNEGKVLDTGLWKYTRHPNYFGDFLIWWGLYLVAISMCNAWWTVASPILMSFLLMRVSGVTLLDKALTKTKPGYADYVARTNAFFPGRSRG